MENSLQARNEEGVEDFVLLENFQSEEAFLENLEKRFRRDRIYTYIGPVLVSVNPYKELPIYGQAMVEKYHNIHFYEAPPHLFAIVDNAFRVLREEVRDQCILISGESGAGKTEASKKVLEYVSAAARHSSKVNKVKERLLRSNPVLEAFGNARTTRNDNSSRFGKYMDIEFNFMGDPIGGHILNFLLEKARVVGHAPGERNFHIFYQLLAGGDNDLLSKLGLVRDHTNYHYLQCGNDGSKSKSAEWLSTDASQFKSVCSALEVLGLGEDERCSLLTLVAAILHLGNVTFTSTDDNDVSHLDGTKVVAETARLLGCDEGQLAAALTKRTIEAKGEMVTTPLNIEQAAYARDALAKALYDRIFTWLVRWLNASLQSDECVGRKTLLGILDIYGFEILTLNSFEQFCINFCNEKLHQLFVELTLRSEQEEYRKEGIQWEEVKFFDNQIICDLVEERQKGIIPLLDEECLRPGEPSDLTFLAKLDEKIGKHPHYDSYVRGDRKAKKTIGRNEFKIKHYAGDVTYNVASFLDKNNDLLFYDLRKAMVCTTNFITKAMFPACDLDSKRRPQTVAFQFRQSVAHLMTTLRSKEPSYIRCIKPNDEKRSGILDHEVVSHQVRYLGLMENLRVRRAGFAYRRPYESFLRRYKSLCPATWPSYSGEPKEGVRLLVTHLGYGKDDFRLGKTKLFIRHAKTLFDTEDAFQKKKHELAAMIQSTWKGHVQRKAYLRIRTAALLVQKLIRGYLARRAVAKRKQAVIVIQKFIIGFISRNSPNGDANAKFLQLARCKFLERLARSLPKKILDNYWPPTPKHSQEASALLHKLHTRCLVRNYMQALTPERKHQLQLKVLAEKLFKDKKQGYPETIPEPFVPSRLGPEQTGYESALGSNEKLVYATPVTKFDRHGYRPRRRLLLVSATALHLLDHQGVKSKHRIPLNTFQAAVVSPLSDSLLLLRIPTELKKDKGDLILEVPYLIEAITQLMSVAGHPELLRIEAAEEITHNLSGGKQRVIQLQRGGESRIARSKGRLTVVGAPLTAVTAP